MTTDLDTMARASAADLHRRAEAVDSEAALAALHRSAGSRRFRVRRLAPSGRVLAAAAAVVVLLAALAVIVVSRGGDGSERLGTEPSQPVDPSSYGPLLGTLHGLDAPGLTAEVYGPKALDDGSEVAVSITGGRPGQGYAVNQCAVSDDDYNPAANCTIGGTEFRLDAEGNGVGTIRVASVFDASAMSVRNDCRAATCELQVGPFLDDDEGDEPPAGTEFAVQPEPSKALSDSPWVPIRFAAGAGPDVLPEVTATFLARAPEGMRVHLDGTDLQPGRSTIAVDASGQPRSGLLAAFPEVGPVTVTEVDVRPDGTLSVDVVLPDVVAEPATGGEGPDVIRCGTGSAVCEVRVLPVTPEPAGDGSGRRSLSAPPVPYPLGR